MAIEGCLIKIKPSMFQRLIAGALLAAAAGTLAIRLHAARREKARVWGLDRVIAFTYSPTALDARQLRSVTLVGPLHPGEWKYWQQRGVVAAVGHTWFDLLRSPIDQAARNLLGQDYGENPRPVNMID